MARSSTAWGAEFLLLTADWGRDSWDVHLKEQEGIELEDDDALGLLLSWWILLPSTFMSSLGKIMACLRGR